MTEDKSAIDCNRLLTKTLERLYLDLRLIDEAAVPPESTLARLQAIKVCEELIQFNAEFDPFTRTELANAIADRTIHETIPAPEVTKVETMPQRAAEPAPEPAPVPAPTTPDAAEKPSTTLDELRKRITTLCAEHPGLAIPAILKDFGCKRLSDVPAERYEEFAERAKELAETGEDD